MNRLFALSFRRISQHLGTEELAITDVPALLESKGIEFEDIGVDSDPERRREMMELSGRRTVPQIWVGDTHVGGYDDLAALEYQGALDELLEMAPQASWQ